MMSKKTKFKPLYNREMPPPPNKSLRLKYGDIIYRQGDTTQYIVLGEVALREVPPESEDTARDPYG